MTIKLRKIPSKKLEIEEETSIMIETDSMSNVHAHRNRPICISSSSASALSNSDLRHDRDLESGNLYSDSIPVTRKMIEDDVDLGTLILEVIDSGVGMAAEDSKRLFKEVIQFNPSELQVLFFCIYILISRVHIFIFYCFSVFQYFFIHVTLHNLV